MAAAVIRFVSCCGAPVASGAEPIPLREIAIRDDREKVATLGTTEDVLGNWAVDFDLLEPSILDMVATFTFFSKQSAGTGTYRVRLGGTYNVNDGTLVAALTTANAAYPNTPEGVTGAVFARPAGKQLLKMTGARSAAGGTASIQGIEIVLGEEP